MVILPDHQQLFSAYQYSSYDYFYLSTRQAACKPNQIVSALLHAGGYGLHVRPVDRPLWKLDGISSRHEGKSSGQSYHCRFDYGVASIKKLAELVGERVLSMCAL